MKEHIQIAILAISVLFLSFSGCTQQTNLEAERTALREADAHLSERAGANDIEGFVSVFAEDGSILPPNAPTATGHDAIRQWASQSMGNPGFSVQWETDSVAISSAADLGYSTGQYNLKMQVSPEQVITDNGKYVTIWKKDSEWQWKVAVDIFNSSMPLPAMPSGE